MGAAARTILFIPDTKAGSSMRLVGRINWFGGYNKQKQKKNDFGYLSRLGAANNDKDIRVHLSDLECDPEKLQDYTLVTFELSKHNTAKAVRLFDEELASGQIDADTIALCANNTTTWREVFAIYISSLADEEATAYIEARFYDELGYRYNGLERMAAELPERFHLASEIIRCALPPQRHLELCCQMLASSLEEEQIADIYTEIRKRILNPKHSKATEIVSGVTDDFALVKKLAPINPLPITQWPKSLVSDARLFHQLPNTVQIDVLLETYKTQPSPHILTELANLLSQLPVEERHRKLLLQPETILNHPLIVPHRTVTDQANLLWKDAGKKQYTNWQNTAWQARILTIYRAAKEKPNQLDLKRLRNMEDHLLVQAAMILLWAHHHPDHDRKAISEKLHAKITEYLVQLAWTSRKHIDLWPLLPPCRPGIKRLAHCEGRPWLTKEELAEGKTIAEKAWCPRAGKACQLLGTVVEQAPIAGGRRHRKSALRRQANQLVGAHLYPVRNQDWSKWSLTELLDFAKVTPSIPEPNDPDKLIEPDQYVTKLGGWVNRLNEIRPRLHCRQCNEMMLPDPKYARHLAVYNATVFHCSQGNGHDTGVYLNHCWHCWEIIDSRDARIRVQNSQGRGYYLCLHCGSGPKDNTTFQPGDICPQCGQQNMQPSEWLRSKTCRHCNHTIH